VSKSGDETFMRIEETQAALRKSIDKAKELASLSERLIRRHRDEVNKDEANKAEPPNPAS
jgi:hypothetical protein